MNRSEFGAPTGVGCQAGFKPRAPETPQTPRVYRSTGLFRKKRTLSNFVISSFHERDPSVRARTAA